MSVLRSKGKCLKVISTLVMCHAIPGPVGYAINDSMGMMGTCCQKNCGLFPSPFLTI